MQLLRVALIVVCTAGCCSAAVGFNKDGFLTVDGTPYFPVGMYTIRSRDNGRNWSAPTPLVVQGTVWWACSSPVRELPDH